MAEEIALKTAGFPTLKGSWPWPWIVSYCILSCITHRPLPTYARTYERTFETSFIRSSRPKNKEKLKTKTSSTEKTVRAILRAGSPGGSSSSSSSINCSSSSSSSSSISIYYFYLMTVSSVEPRVLLHHLGWKKNLWGLVEWAGCPSCHPTTDVKALNGTQSTNLNHWPDLILSLYTTRLQRPRRVTKSGGQRRNSRQKVGVKLSMWTGHLKKLTPWTQWLRGRCWTPDRRASIPFRASLQCHYDSSSSSRW